MKNVICRHFLLKTRGNGLEGGVQRIQDGYFAVFRLALDERKILVGVVDSTPPAGGSRSSNLLQEANGSVAQAGRARGVKTAVKVQT